MRRLLVAAVFFISSAGSGFAADHLNSFNLGFPESYLLTGLDTIPDDALVLSRAQTRSMFVVSDVVFSYFAGLAQQHNEDVRAAACLAFIILCADHNDILTTPFTFLGGVDEDSPSVATSRLLREIAGVGSVKIVTASGSVGGHIPELHGASLPFLMIEGAGNEGTDNFFGLHVRYDRDTDTFVSLTDRPIHPDDQRHIDNTREAVEANTVLYASGYYVEGGKPYKAGWLTGCIGVEESCVYVPGRSGTSYRSPQLGAALASLLTVFPDYDVFDLARLTSINGCADQYPTLPGGGIVNIPCMIETICEETNSTSSACAVEQPNLDLVVRSSRQVAGLLENPLPDPDRVYANVSGISVVSGWVCDAEEIIIEFNGQPWKAGYGTTRTDTRGVCGDDDNGFSLLFNWNLLGDGVHTVKAYADGVLFATARVKVTGFGEEFVRGGLITDGDFVINSRNFSFKWEESLQNFIITDGTEIALRQGYNTVPGIRGFLENPSLGSYQSGISVVSGWVCDAEEIIIEFNGQPWKAGYGTTRTDTRGVCGDDDNGFSLLFNWNLLGDGVHTVKAYADGVLFADTQVKVTVPAGEFLRGHTNKVCTLMYLLAKDDFHHGCLEWWETQQNLVLVQELDHP